MLFKRNTRHEPTASQIRYWKNSVRLFEHATQATESNCLAYLNFGLAFTAPGNLVENEYYLRKAIEFRPNLFRAHVSLGGVLLQKGDFAGAFNEYSMVQRIVPNDVENQACLANLFENCKEAKFHDLEKAVEHARRACELSHYRRRDLLIFLAEVCGNHGDYREATEAIRRTLALSVSPQEIARANEIMAKIQNMEAQNRQEKTTTLDEN